MPFCACRHQKSHNSRSSVRCTAIAPPRQALLHDYAHDLIPYQVAWKWQKRLVDHACQHPDAPDRLLLLQHPPVYTLGTGSTPAHLSFSEEDAPLPLYRTERGGEVTYHGPGQLVAYPILNLHRHRTDLHWYLRQLEQVIINSLRDVSNLHGERVDGLTGVWVQGAKVAAIGVRASRWITYHGLALNVDMDLRPFGGIVPCGIADRQVTSIEQLLLSTRSQGGHVLGVAEHVRARGVWTSADSISSVANRDLIEAYRSSLISSFGTVFGLEVTLAPPNKHDPLTLM